MDKYKINILIVDDDELSLKASRQKIGLYADKENIHTAQNAAQVMDILAKVHIDLAFIDVEMPDIDGFSIADYLRIARPGLQYVFLTGHTELGAKSYDYEPLDFLSKPLDAMRLKKTFERFEKARSERPASKEQFVIEGTAGFMLVSLEDILYITREKRKTVLYDKNGAHPVKGTLEELEIMLGDFGIFRCHNSFLVSLAHIESVRQSDYGRTYTARLEGGQEVPVSRGRYPDMLKELKSKGIRTL